jgi:hypothetical protein
MADATINRYTNGKIYRLVNSVDDEIYVGSTCSTLAKRFYGHKKDAERELLPAYKHLNKVGWNNVSIVLIEEYSCENKNQLERRERYWIETLKATLNKAIPTRTIKEWHEDNKDKIKEHNAKYRADNIEKIRETQAKWYVENAEKRKEYIHNNKNIIAEKKKEYREKNKEVIAEKKKQYHERNRENLNSKKREHYQQNREALTEKAKEYRKTNCEAVRARDRERYAKKKAEREGTQSA